MVKLRLLGSLLLALTLAAPVTALEVAPRAPLLEALAFVPRHADVPGFDFVDWTQLKTLHGGAHINGDSPLAARQRLLLDIARDEAAPMPFGFDRLPRWSEAWGWDSTDLEWEARIYGEVAVMRFGQHWDADRFRGALAGFGYRPEDIGRGTVYHPDPAAEVPWQLRFANMHGLDIHGRVITEPMVQVAVTDDGRTVVFTRAHDAGLRLQAALDADPRRAATSSFGRAAEVLGRPVAAAVLAGDAACSAYINRRLEGDARRLAASVAPLHQYQALAAGYNRARAGDPADGRYVFVYEQAEQARDDLPGRRVLIEQGYQYDDDVSRYADVAFSLADAHVVETGLVLDVTPVDGAPVHVLRNMQIKPAVFATCGPVLLPAA